MKRNRPITFLLALAASLFLAGCWGSTKEESRAVPTTTPTLQGDNLSAVARMCATCHSVLPSHAPLAIRANLDTACTDCHRDPLPHAAGRIEVNRQWAASGHADFAALPWSEDDFKSDAESSCHRCHTATGYERFTDNQLAYHQSNYIVADNLAFVANSVTGSKMEVLYCRGCHAIDPASGMALDGPRRQVQNAYLPRGNNKNYTPDNVAKAGVANLFTLTRAEIGDSVLCSNCHAGRKAGAHVHNILGDNAATYAASTSTT
jgi:predicted CXXCH cytochrome family protein